MRFFAIFFLMATIGCAYFWATDAPGSGMGYPTVGFAVLAGGVLLYTKRKTGRWLSDKSGGR